MSSNQDNTPRVHMRTSPSEPIDDSIFEEMEVLEKLIDFHSREYAKGNTRIINSIMPAPPEIRHILDVVSIQDDWRVQKYDIIRVLWAKAWIRYYSAMYDMPPSYTDEEYAQISASKNS